MGEAIAGVEVGRQAVTQAAPVDEATSALMTWWPF
jgi:hypothetical protein